MCDDAALQFLIAYPSLSRTSSSETDCEAWRITPATTVTRQEKWRRGDDSTDDFRPPHERSTIAERASMDALSEKNPWIGKVIGGRYTLVELLGEGGMGEG